MNVPPEQAATTAEEFMGGLSEEGKRLAVELKRLLTEKGINLQEGARIKQSEAFEVLREMDIKANFFQAMVAPSLLQEASGLIAEWTIDPDKHVGYYLLKRPSSSSLST